MTGYSKRELNKMKSHEQKTCFVIMPFNDKPDPAKGDEIIPFNDVYEFIIKAAIKAVEPITDLRCIRSDEISESGWIHADMIDYIFRADIVIVDITTLNANVFYELGVRHTAKPSGTILIRKEGTEIPFDIRGLRVIKYDLDVKHASKAIEEITAFIKNSLRHKRRDSIVYNVFPDLKVLL